MLLQKAVYHLVTAPPNAKGCNQLKALNANHVSRFEAWCQVFWYPFSFRSLPRRKLLPVYRQVLFLI